MRKRIFYTGLAFLFFSCLFLLTPLFLTNSSDSPNGSLFAQGNWRRAQKRGHYTGDELYGYINGGAEIFKEYGFKELFVSHYTSRSGGGKKELTMEVYRMESPESAFGIFSVKRTGDEKVSEKIDGIHWVSQAQVNILKAEFYINIVGFETEEGDLEQFAIPVPGRVLGENRLPKFLEILPAEDKIENSERYILGKLAGSQESVLLKDEFWGFEEGTVAVSARYNPSNSKIIVLDFGEEKMAITPKVGQLFTEYLEDVEITDDVVHGAVRGGHFFLFKQKGNMGVFVLGERDMGKAHEMLDAVLEKIE